MAHIDEHVDPYYDCITVQPGFFIDEGPAPPDGGGDGEPDIYPGGPNWGTIDPDDVHRPGPPGPPEDPDPQPDPNLVCTPGGIIGCMDPEAGNYDSNATIPCVDCCVYPKNGDKTGGDDISTGPKFQTFTFPFISFDLGAGDGAEETKHYVVPANAPLSEANTTFSVGVGDITTTFYGGDLVVPITAQIIDLPYGDSSVPTLEVTIPTDLDSMNQYLSHSGETVANIVYSFDILFTYDLPFDNSSDFVEYYRYHWFFTQSLSIIPNTGPAEEPDITYDVGQVDLHYNSTALPVEISPTKFDLAGNTVEITAITQPPGSPYDEGVPTDEPPGYITVSPEGVITLYSYPEDIEISNLPIELELTFTFSEAPQQKITFTVNAISDETSQPKFDYDGTIPLIVYYGVDAPNSTIIPSVWEMNNNSVQFDPRLSQPLQSIPCGNDGVCWGLDSDSDGWGDDFSFNPADGIITVTGWKTSDPGTVPEGLQVYIEIDWLVPGNWSGTIPSGGNNIFEVTFVEASLYSGGGENILSIPNPQTGGVFKVPKSYSTLKGTRQISKRLIPARTSKYSKKRVGPTYVQRITPGVVPIDEQKRAYFNTIYSDGLRNTNYTFFNAPTVSPDLRSMGVSPIDYSLTGVYAPGYSIFRKNSMDFAVKNIFNINENPALYNDFSYNTLSTKKIKKSLQAKIVNLFGTRAALDGSPYIDKLLGSLSHSLVMDETSRYTAEEVLMLSNRLGGSPVSFSTDPAQNRSQAVEIMQTTSRSLNVDDYTLGNKNRLLNWKILAEDVNKNIKLKTADGTETPLYIPNAETIPVYDSLGGAHTLVMQDGDYFVADPLVGDKRLAVYSDRNKARVLPLQSIAQASRLLEATPPISITCTSLESSLVELDVDTTEPRQGYYFLALDKSTIEDDIPETLGSRKTKGTYTYLTSTSDIDAFVKHKAFPYLTVFIRDDDIIFNHLEVTKEATVTFTEPSLEYLTNSESVILVRRMPWYIIVVPTDRTVNVPSQARSRMVDFSTRILDIEYSSKESNTDSNLTENPWLNESIITTGGINFKGDQIGNVIYQETREYSVNFTKIEEIPKYRRGFPVTPRKLQPTNVLLKKLKEIKGDFSLTERDSIKFYDLFSRLKPHEFRSLSLDQVAVNNFYNKLRVNKITDTTSINKDNFIPVKDVYTKPLTTVTVLDPAIGGSIFSKQGTTGGSTGGGTEREVRPGAPVY